MSHRQKNFNPMLSTVLALAIAGCNSPQRPSPGSRSHSPHRPSGQACVVTMFVESAHLGIYLRMFGRYPERVTEEEARKNEWTCGTGKSPYEYLFLGPVQLPLLI